MRFVDLQHIAAYGITVIYYSNFPLIWIFIVKKSKCVQIKYHGLIKLRLETKVNLMKLKENEAEAPATGKLGAVPYTTSALRTTPSRYSDEEIPESPETSPDEEFGTKMRDPEKP